MIKYKFLFFLLLVVTSVSQASDCFQYKALGEIRRNDTGLALIVNAKSASEYKIEIMESEWPQVVPYVDKNLNIEFIAKEKMKGFKGNLFKVTKVDSTLVDPMKDGLENRLFLQGKIKCP